MNVLEMYKVWINSTFRSDKCGFYFEDGELDRIIKELTSQMRKPKGVLSREYDILFDKIIMSIIDIKTFECTIGHKLTKKEREVVVEYIKERYHFYGSILRGIRKGKKKRNKD